MAKEMPDGVYTAIITPFLPDGEIDEETLVKLTEFQISQGVAGIVPVGTTGESATIPPHKHNRPTEIVIETVKGRAFVLAGTGGNSLEEAMEFTRLAYESGADGYLWVEPYYNAPSSMEINEEYFKPLAKKFPERPGIIYNVPSRSGCKYLISHLIELATICPSVIAVKDATGDPGRMSKIREKMPQIKIFCGDDSLNYQVIARPDIRGNGFITVVGNAFPGTLVRMQKTVRENGLAHGKILYQLLEPFSRVVTISYSNNFNEKDRSKNPVPFKALLYILGMIPHFYCKPPLGKLEKPAASILRRTLTGAHQENPDLFEPIEAFFEVKVGSRIDDDSLWNEVTYP